MKCKQQDELGFTLVELMITIAVLAVLASLAAPTFVNQMAKQDVRSAAEGLATKLNRARADAQITPSDIPKKVDITESLPSDVTYTMASGLLNTIGYDKEGYTVGIDANNDITEIPANSYVLFSNSNTSTKYRVNIKRYGSATVVEE